MATAGHVGQPEPAHAVAVERTIRREPEVRYAFSRTGTSEIAFDPKPPNASDTFVILTPGEWPNPRLPKAELFKRIEQKVSTIPGNAYEITQPTQMRFKELIAGMSGDIAVKVFGLPLLDIRPNRDAMARAGVTAGHVQDVVSATVGGSDSRGRPAVPGRHSPGLGAGAEVQKPLATVVIGGLLTATLLTLFVFSTVYARFGGGRMGRPSIVRYRMAADPKETPA